MIFAIDPGPKESGFVILTEGKQGPSVLEAGNLGNCEMLAALYGPPGQVPETLAVEWMEPRRNHVGDEVFETCLWAGRFIEAFAGSDADPSPIQVAAQPALGLHAPRQVWLPRRRDIKRFFGLPMNSKDADVRLEIVREWRRWGQAEGGGKNPIVGVKNEPGPLYNVKRHAWPALAVALWARHKIREGV